MSNYTLTSPIDVKSTAVTGSILVYNPSGTNYVNVTAPTSLAGNVDFTLPSTVGTTGQYLQRTGASSLGWANGNATNYPFPYNALTLATTSTALITTTSTTNVSYAQFIFPGTTALNGNTPRLLMTLGSNSATTTIGITVSDITNATTVATITTGTFVAGAPTVFNVTPLSNLSTTASVWQILVRRASGTGTCQFYGYTVLG
jgi:hypothetical protein